MGLITGLLLGLGLVLVWSSFWTQSQKRKRSGPTPFLQELHAAGFVGVSVPMFVTASILLAVICATTILVLTKIPVMALVGAVAGGFVLTVVVRHRAVQNRRRRRELWPDVIEHLLSGIRAGLSLPEALIAVGQRGPQDMRVDFSMFARDYRASGNLDQSLKTMKTRLADPTADRVIEALRLTKTVGGSELGTLLETLNKFLRQDIRTRGELEARQSWTVGGARVAVAAPWLILVMLATRPEAALAYSSAQGAALIAIGAVATIGAYMLMLKLGALPSERRVLA
jgi:tight adherence protein B